MDRSSLCKCRAPIGAVRLWDIATGQTLSVVSGHAADAQTVVFSPDGKLVATSGDHDTAGIWNLLTGKDLMVLKQNDNVTGIAFSPDEKYLVTCSFDGSVRLWEVATGKEVRRFAGHTSEVRAVAFSPDGKYILTASFDGTSRLWFTDIHNTIRAVCALLTSEERIQFGVSNEGPTCPAQ